MFYHTDSEQPFDSIESFRLAHPNTSFGDLYDQAYRESIGLFDVDVSIPFHDEELQKATPSEVVCSDGRYILGYVISDRALTSEQRMAILMRRFELALDTHLDSTAQQRRYDSRVTCALRAGYPGPFRAEGEAFASWMDQCNTTAYALLADVQRGVRELPSDPQALIDLLPAMVWPS